MVVKIRVLLKCEYCNGQAYLPAGETEDYLGRKYLKYKECPQCNGSGTVARWAALDEVQQLLEQIECPHLQSSRIGNFHFSAGETWDDIHEQCHSCGKILD